MKELLNFRYYVLAALGSVGLTLLLMDCPDSKPFTYWIQFQLGAKAVALACFWLVYRLINYWNPKGRIRILTDISEYLTKIIDQ